MSIRLGFAFTSALAPEQLRPIARAVEEAGLDELWLWEDCFTASGVASAALALGATDRITVGLGLLPTPLRNVALTAMELATLERAVPGRLVGGIGHGVQAWMEQVGVRAASPVTLLREYATALRRLLDGETVTTAGDYVRLRDVALGFAPERRLPLMIGGRGPVTVGVAGELGDGLLLGNAYRFDEIADSAASARDRAGRDELPVVYSIVAATGPDAAARVDRSLRAWRPDADPVAHRYAVAAGDASAIADCVRDVAAQGVTNVVIEPTADEPDPIGFIRFLGRELRPLTA